MNRPEAIRALIASGADVNAKHNRGGTPLDMAKSERRADAAQTLVDAGGSGRGWLTRWLSRF